MDTGLLNIQVGLKHRDKTRMKLAAKMFPHLKLTCWLFMGSTLGFLIKIGVFYNKSKIMTILFIVKLRKLHFLVSF